ncbi:hypothetical protein MAR_015824 [Mya arenaria]|uniref:Uncharacterized protein n=1 Tax=Mya arenaria TaxID=6604 RepID=A0ABY7FI42_MYAAR|nr:hypothetical protein MAR_015824 [Mya arenaria]
MTLPMLRILPPPWDFRLMTSNSQREAAERFVSDKYESIQRLAMVPAQPPRNPNKPYTSFRINDILNSSACSPDVSPQRRPHRPSSRNPRGVESPPKSADTEHNRLYKLQSQHRHQQNLIRYPHAQKHNGSSKHTNNNNRDIVHRVAPPPPPPPAHLRIVRPWDASPSPGRTSEASSDADDEEITVDDEDAGPPKQRTASLKDVSPLDALMEMANKTFQGLETSEAAEGIVCHLNKSASKADECWRKVALAAVCATRSNMQHIRDDL